MLSDAARCTKARLAHAVNACPRTPFCVALGAPPPLAWSFQINKPFKEVLAMREPFPHKVRLRLREISTAKGRPAITRTEPANLVFARFRACPGSRCAFAGSPKSKFGMSSTAGSDGSGCEDRPVVDGPEADGPAMGASICVPPVNLAGTSEYRFLVDVSVTRVRITFARGFTPACMIRRDIVG